MMPCCYDGLTAKLIERAGFEATFMSGFGVSAVHGFPDVQVVSHRKLLLAIVSITCLVAAFIWGNGSSRNLCL